ncbi:TRAP transporter small permease [Lysinibacillus capsici]|uniref:C4-dicarboxylate transport system permease small protein n=1 Tax=Lysinibacillus capsici TaxID=2115968 RepID=A0A2X0Y280_9BACI|nr:TRAP transporter small permease [Lysinibacillus capsici]MED4552950.1 TRAP transporter small permease [Lysinibacillus capsici]WNN77528.1 TRAP transporter small permease [Lysinibacillus capsici]SPU00118.1 C4-dicarboxylate transport system permease small protein [Lysinibacillus capsici]
MKINNVINKIMSYVLGVLFIFMTLLATYQVVARYVFNAPSTISEDLLSYSFVWLSLIGATVLFTDKGHMNIDFLYDKMSSKIQNLFDIITNILVLVTSILIFIYGGVKLIDVGSLQISPTLNIPLSYVYSIFPIMGVILLIICICNIYETITKKLKQG